MNAYFAEVDRVQASLAPQLQAANRAFHRFSGGASSASDIRSLVRALATIAALHAHLAGLHPPSQAAKLHRDLLQLVSLEENFAGSVVSLARYRSRLEAIFADVSAAGGRLQAGLSPQSSARQAKAVMRYARSLDVQLARAARLAPPRAAKQLQATELAALRATASVSHRLAAALRCGPRRNVARLAAQLASLSSPAKTKDVQAAELAAVRSFNRRLSAIKALASSIDRERVALARHV